SPNSNRGKGSGRHVQMSRHLQDSSRFRHTNSPTTSGRSLWIKTASKRCEIGILISQVLCRMRERTARLTADHCRQVETAPALVHIRANVEIKLGLYQLIELGGLICSNSR